MSTAHSFPHLTPTRPHSEAGGGSHSTGHRATLHRAQHVSGAPPRSGATEGGHVPVPSLFPPHSHRQGSGTCFFPGHIQSHMRLDWPWGWDQFAQGVSACLGVWVWPRYCPSAQAGSTCWVRGSDP